MDRVNHEICKNCRYVAAFYDTKLYWQCLSRSRTAQTVFDELSKPPLQCPYREMSLDEAIADQIADRLM